MENSENTSDGSIILYDFGGTVGVWEPACDIMDVNHPELRHCAVLCDTPNGPRIICSVSPMENLSGEDMANGWLISAAPELLAVCQSFLRTGDFSGMSRAVLKATGKLS